MFELKVSTDNAAFEGEEGMRAELARILREAADRVAGGICGRVPIRDINGNRVGHFDVPTPSTD